ncbi:amino acid adenylation domain-containing protein [Pseudomonas sp. SDO528_S397]
MPGDAPGFRHSAHVRLSPRRIRVKPSAELYPLTRAQRQIWFDQALHEGSPLYKIGGHVRIDGPVDPQRFEQAVNQLVQHHDALRIQLDAARDEEGVPLQRIVASLPVRVPMHDFSAQDDAEAAAQALLARRLETPFALIDAPLFRFELLKVRDDRFYFTLNFHHLIADGWSIGLLVESLSTLYSDAGTPEAAAPTYQAYIEEDLAWQQSPQHPRNLAYWVDKYRDVPPPLLHARYAGQHTQGPVPSGHDCVRLSRGFFERVVALASRCEATPYHVMLGLFYTYFSRTQHCAELAVGVPTLNRGNARLKATAGLFIGISPVRLQYDPALAFSALVKSLGQTLKQDYRFQRFALSDLNRHLELWRSQRAQVFDLTVSYERDDHDLRFDDAPAQVIMGTNGYEQEPLTVHIRENKYDDNVWIHFFYSQACFNAQDITQLGERVQHLLAQVLEAAETPVAELNLLTDDDARHLARWNDTRVTQPAMALVHRQFEAQAACAPQAIALELHGQSLTYAQLNARANQVAHRLLALGVAPDQCVAICVERSLEGIVGLLGILKAGAAYVPLDPAYPVERLQLILADVTPKALLVHAATASLLADSPVPVLDLDALGAPDTALPNPEPAGLDASKLAYVIYTSGSTGQPKGVMVEHGSLLNHLQWQTDTFGLGDDDAFLQRTSMAFDASVWEIWTPLALGARLVLLPDEAARDIEQIVETIQRHRVSVAQFVPSLLRLVVDHPGPPIACRYLFSGGEPLDAQLARQASALTRQGLVNLYGPTEATIDSTAWRYTPQPEGVPLPIGQPIANTRVYVLDARLQSVPVGVTGELYIAGAAVARGYLNRPQLTAERFLQDPFSDEPGARLYRTGDLGCWRADGQLAFLGRVDEQVKIRGLRIEPGEIEATLAHVEGVQKLAVLAREVRPGDVQLVAYYVAAKSMDEALRLRARAALPAHMVPSAFVHLPGLPLTVNGKLDRKALPAPNFEARAAAAYEAPHSPQEKLLAPLWQQILGVERVGRHANFFELGGHSLSAVRLIESLRQRGLKAEARALFGAPTLAEFARQLTQQERVEVPANRIGAGCTRLTPDLLPLVDLSQAQLDGLVAGLPGGAANVQDIYPLAPLQEGILYHHLAASDTDPYRLMGLFALDTRARLDRFIHALQAVIARHDILRTALVWEGLDSPVQVVLREVSLPVQWLTLDAHEGAIADQLLQRCDARHMRLDLRQAPLLHLVCTFDAANERWLALLVVHHIALDNVALKLLRHEVQAYLLDDQPSLPAPAPYRNYVAQSRDPAAVAAHEAYFRERLHDIESPSLPYGVAHIADDVNEVIEPVPAAVAQRLRQQARQAGISVASVFHLAWGRVLALLCGQQEVVFGSVLLGRMQGHDSREQALGLFINTLPLRLSLGEQRVDDNLRDTARRLASLLGHEQASLALAQRCSGVAASTPLFSALLNYRHNDEHTQHDWQGVELLSLEERTHYPLTLSVDDWGHGFGLTVQAASPLDAGFICASLQTVLAGLAYALEQAPHTPVHDLPALPATERQRVLYDFNATDTPYPQGLTLHGLFEAQARATPETVALVFEAQRLTYAALNRQANHLAHRLIAHGVKPGDRVAICVERSLEMVVGLFAILKAGGAYVPLDPGYPLERLTYMLADSAPAALLVHGQTRALLQAGSTACIDLDECATTLDGPAHDPALAVDERQLAYVIYTSGSTGQPKGVMNEHHGVVNRLLWMQQALCLTPQDRVLQKTPFSFDVSVWEFFWPLMTGARLVIARPDGHRDPDYLSRLIAQQGITTLHFVPSMLQVFLELAEAAECQGLTRVICSGEALPLSTLRRALTLLPQAALHNLYGPTEAAVDVTAWQCSAEDALSLIGRPIANTRIYILDARGQPVPVGIAGELHIAGVQVARGYLNRPDLTAERFVHDPFHPTAQARMYKTGDLARWLPNGAIEYLGRNDDQVKIRGLRIEPGEIEAVLAQLAGVQEVAVLARENGVSGKRLVAYYTGDVIARDHLREHASRQLAPHMVPSAFVHVPAWPLTPNGKLNRKALPEPEGDAAGRSAYEGPVGDVEALLAQIWSQLLGVERVSRHDQFYELGGHSLLAVSLVEHLRRAGLFIEISALLAAPTLADLASQVSRERQASTLVANAIEPGATHITPAMLTLVDLTQAQIDKVLAQVPGGAANVQDIYPLAPLQEGILYHHLTASDADPYELQSLFAFESQAVLDAVIDALQQVIDRHDALRTAVHWQGLDTPVQVVWRHAPLEPEQFVCDPELGDVAGQMQRWFDTRQRGMNLNRAPLLEWFYAKDEANQRWVGMLRFHHIALDHVALAFVQQEVQAILQGRGAQLAASVPYRNYVIQARSGTAAGQHEAWFGEQLQDIDEPTLPYGIAGIQADAGPVQEAAAEVPAALTTRLRSQARQLGVSAASLYHLAWARVLAVLAGRESVVFGTVLLGRLQGGAGADRALGLFINTLPVRLDVNTTDVQTGVQQTARTLAALLAHEHASLALAQRCSGVAAPTPLFSALLNYRHSEGQDTLAVGQDVWPGARLLAAHERTHYPLVLCVDDRGNQFDLVVQAAAGIDPRQVRDGMLTALAALVDALEQAPQTPLNTLPVLPAAERLQVLQGFNSGRVEHNVPDTLHRVFEAQAARTPQALALTCEGQSLTYRELDTRANRLAHRLIAHGVKPDDRVAICVEPGLEMLVGVLGILKAGAGYVPLDPNYPLERLSWVLEDSQPAVVLLSADTLALLGPLPVVQVCITDILDDGPAHTPQVPGLGAEHLAYVIYTSGSTGQPKGVMIEHRQVTRLFQATAGQFGFGEADVWALFHSFAFDFSVWEIWGALLHGGRLLVVPHLTRRSPQACYALLCDEDVTVLNQTPSAFGQLITAQGETPRGHALRHVIFGGEALDVASLKPWYARPQNAHTQLVNMYGITETTVHVTYRALTPADTAHNGSPIGAPLDDLRLYLLDPQRQPVPVGVVGELYVAGAGVARGYLNRPALTAERFVHDPFSDTPSRMYKSGDLGRWLPNGEVEYLGRNDAQVKIRGFRIELGEIEAALSAVPGVAHVRVIARQDLANDQRLVAYYTGSPSLNLALHEQASLLLPAHMVPSAFVHLAHLPLTVNGKLDHKALPAPGLDALVRAQFEAPQGDIETTLARIWSALLAVDPVSRHDNFFELGGHSLLAVSLVERLRQAGLSVDIRTLFGAPTLAELASHVHTQPQEQAVPPNRIAAQCQRLTPDMLTLISLDQPALDHIARQVSGGAANIQDIYPLAPLQEGILFHHLMEQTHDPYLLNGTLGFKTREALQGFVAALQQVIDRHDILRTGFVWDGLEQAVQVVHRQAPLVLDETGEQPLRLDISQAPLLRCAVAEDPAAGRWLLHIVFHHLVLDHTSLDRVLEEALAFARGDGAQLPAPAPFRNFIAQNRLTVSTQAHEAFFKQMLGAVDTPTAPFGVLDVTGDGRDVVEVQRPVPDALSHSLRQQARRLGVSAASVMHLAWALVLAKTTGQARVVFGTVLFGRLQGGAAADRVLGLFINTLPLCVDLGGHDANTSLRQTHDGLIRLLAHEHAPLSLAQRCSAVPAPNPLFTALLNYRYSAQAPQSHEPSALADGIEQLGGRERTNYPLVMAVDDLGEAFSLTLQAVPGIDAERVCADMLDALAHLNTALGSGLPTPVAHFCGVVVQARPTPLPAAPAAPAGYAAPQGEVEQQLARIWATLLGVERVGREDNFFERGGDSLLAMRVAGAVRQAFGDRGSLRALFDSRSLKDFAARVVVTQALNHLAITPQPRHAPLPLSFVQERLWLIQTRDGGRAYNWHGALELQGELSLPALHAAFAALQARHEPLRTRFKAEGGDGVPLQWIDAPTAIALPVREISAHELPAALRHHGRTEFNLDQGALIQVQVMRLAPTRHVLSMVIHHIVSDGWSTAVLVGDLRALYLAQLSGQDAALAPLAIQQADYAYWQRHQDLSAQREYWRATLADAPEPVDLCVPGTPTAVAPGPVRVCRRRVDAHLAARLAQFSQQRNTSLFTLLLAGWAVVAWRQSGRDDLLIGTTVAGRDDPLLDPLIGFFVNILPLRLRVDSELTLAQLLTHTHTTVVHALEHQALPFEQMLAAAPHLRQPAGRSPLPVMLRHQNFPGVDSQPWGDTLSVHEWPLAADRTAHADLDLEVFGDARALELVASFDTLRFGAAQVELMLSVWLDTLARMVEAPQHTLTGLLALTADEHALIAASNATAQAFEPTSVNALFAREVAQHPEALACLDDAGEYSYAWLARRSRAIAATLQRRGVGQGACIALYQPRSADYLASVLAVFTLGAHYVPVDPGYPAAYVQRIISAAQPVWVLTTSRLAPSLTGAPLLQLDLEVDPQASTPVAEHLTCADDVAYIAYTSGSTGEPKGVVVEHRQVLNGLQALWARMPFAAHEVVAQKTSMSFVPSVKELLGGLLVGVPQVILADATVKDVVAFATALHEHRVTRLNLVPSHLDALLDQAAHLGHLRHVVTAGEPLSHQLQQRFAALLPQARLHNNYGCTELNDITYSEGAEEYTGAMMPAGRPIANVRVHVLDAHLRPVPVGAPGRLFVEGAGVGPGYWNQPSLSAERFVQLPSGERALHTGDLGQWLADGQLLHLGREDFQIKVRGQRVELPAVELALASYPGLHSVAAVARQDQLIAFYVADTAVDHNGLHDWLSQRLPDAMVPSRFIPLPALPRLPNGKLDRLTLGTMSVPARAQRPDEDDAPQGPLESTLTTLWAQVLELERVGRHDNFFALGGHSLMASQLVVRIREALRVELSVRDIFDTRSVARLARLLDAQAPTTADEPPLLEFNPQGTQRPLFLTHTLQGYSWYFEHLAAHIDPDVPVYGLPPLPLDAPQHDNLKDIAARFIGLIRSVQPHGPYRLAGWSFGGLSAYEIATQLQEQGQAVEFLGLFDTTLPPQHTPSSAHHASLVTLHAFVTNNFVDHAPGLINITAQHSVEAVVEDIVNALHSYRQAGRTLWHLAHATPQQDRLFLQRLLAHARAMHSWRPRPLAGRMHLFVASDTTLTPKEGHDALPLYLGWEHVLAPAQRVRVEVPGDHETMVKVHAQTLGAVIGEVLG